MIAVCATSVLPSSQSPYDIIISAELRCWEESEFVAVSYENWMSLTQFRVRVLPASWNVIDSTVNCASSTSMPLAGDPLLLRGIVSTSLRLSIYQVWISLSMVDVSCIPVSIRVAWVLGRFSCNCLRSYPISSTYLLITPIIMLRLLVWTTNWLLKVARCPDSVVHATFFQFLYKPRRHFLKRGLVGSCGSTISPYFSITDSRWPRVCPQFSRIDWTASQSWPAPGPPALGEPSGFWASLRDFNAELREYSWFSTSRNWLGADFRPFVSAWASFHAIWPMSTTSPMVTGADIVL